MIGDRLKELRHDHNDTQEDLAEKLNISKFTVQSWEQGKSEPNHEMLVSICRLYHVSSDFLAATSPKAWDFTGNLLGDKAVTVVFDCSKLKRVVPAFQAVTRFDEGVRRCVDHILAHPELQVEDPDFDAWCDRVIEAQESVARSF